MVSRVVVLLWATIGVATACIQLLDGWKQVSVEERARRAQIVFHGLAITTFPESNPVSYTAQFWIINVYKGAEYLAQHLKLDTGHGGIVNLRDR